MKMVKLLLSRNQYLASGIHIGMKQKTKDMSEYIYKSRAELTILNLKKIDEKIRVAAKFLSRFQKILVVGRRPTSHNAIKKFGEIVGAKVIAGKLVAGTLTNPHSKHFYEPDVVFIVDPFLDKQALEESVKMRIPVVALCNTINETRNIDLVIPANNRGKKSLALIFWLLAREILKERKVIQSNKDYKYKIEEFL
jgi:small subunit ribosomal protein S2